MAHARKQGGKELLWMLGIPTVIAAGIFYWFINDIDSQFTVKPAYAVPTATASTNTVTPITEPASAQNQADTETSAAITQAPAPVAETEDTQSTPSSDTTDSTPTENLAITPVSTTINESITENAVDTTSADTPVEASTPDTDSAETAENVVPENDTAIVLGAAGPRDVPIETEPETTTPTAPTTSDTIDTITLATAVTPDTSTEGTATTAPEVITETTSENTAENTADTTATLTTPDKTGWIYIGQFKDQQWLSSGFDILDQMPKIGEAYTLTWGANIRAQPPAKRTVAGETPQLAENVGYLAIGKQVEVLNIRRSGNKGHIWVEIPR